MSAPAAGIGAPAPRAIVPPVDREPLGADALPVGRRRSATSCGRLIPVAEAVLFSFNPARSISMWSGFSMRWYTGDPNGSVLHDPDAAARHRAEPEARRRSRR